MIFTWKIKSRVKALNGFIAGASSAGGYSAIELGDYRKTRPGLTLTQLIILSNTKAFARWECDKILWNSNFDKGIYRGKNPGRFPPVRLIGDDLSISYGSKKSRLSLVYTEDFWTVTLEINAESIKDIQRKTSWNKRLNAMTDKLGIYTVIYQDSRKRA